MKKIIILTLWIGILFTSCEQKLDLEGNWVEFKRYENSLDSDGIMER